MTNKQNFTSIGNELSAAEFKGVVVTKLEYIERAIKENRASIRELNKQNQLRKDWQETFDTKTRVAIGIASFLGGVFVWIADKVFKFFSDKP